MAQMLIGTKAQLSHLRRLAIVFSHELRQKIVTELYPQQMSPTGFYKAFDGGSRSKVARHFRRLTEHRWLRFLRKESGGRRGPAENLYRATELAIFSNDTWSLLPYSLRVAFSGTTFRQFSERVQEAMQAGTFDARRDRHFTWTPVVLDQLGWRQGIAAVDDLFRSLAEEQADARLRVAHSGEKPFLATVALAAFESPSRPGSATSEHRPNLAEGVVSPLPVIPRLSKVFADPICLKIITETNLRKMSAPQFYEEFGGDSVDGIRRRFKMVADLAFVSKVAEETGGRRRGAVEHFYQAAGPAIFDDCAWAKVPEPIRASYGWTIFEQLSEQVGLAMKAGTFDARLDRHLTWSLLSLDQFGWERVIAALEALFEFVLKTAKNAQPRLDRSGERPITTTVAFAAFESPRSTKARL